MKDQAGAGVVETRGIDFIPDDERHGSPSSLFWVFVGAQFSFTVIVFGWLPVAFGLGWWSSFTAIVVGLVIGTMVYTPFALFGPRTGTNSAVSSGAHFGVVGRIIGSILAMVTAVGFFAISIWTGGDSLVAGANRLFGTPDSDAMAALAYAVAALITIAIAIYGFDTVVAAQKFVVPILGLVMVVGVFALASKFDPSYAGGAYLLGDFWPTWLLSVATVASLPISYAPFANDYSRYISRRVPNSRLLLANGVGMFIGCAIACLFGAYMASIFGAAETSFVGGFISISPTWFVTAVILFGLLGSFGQGSVCLYGTGLDFSSLIPKLPRVSATLAVSAISLLLVFVGRFVWDVVDSISAFVILLVVILTPWVIINLIGFAFRKGQYDVVDLQVFNAGQRGGIYWFTGGWNFRAVGAFVPAIVVGLLCLNTTLYTGPWANVANGVDVSLLASAGVAAVLYPALMLIFPERGVVPTHLNASLPSALEVNGVLE
ncbi:purine-cytosine permease family protein [Nocardioides taihuensis]|uniref:Purine-cytosine permease family protein n=1 Tax=Nocardioides taihuensis TaxID=1835606 RepID=A0ABW0BEE3_9ACTN